MVAKPFLAAAALAMVIVGSARTAQLSVTPATFAAALARAKGGDNLLLQPGIYRDLRFYGKTWSPALIITSAEPSRPAVLTNFDINEVQGLTFAHVDFHVLTPAYVGFNVYASQNITFDHVHLYGPAGPPDETVEGIRFFDSSKLSFTNSDVEQVSHGVSFARSDHIIVSDNNIHNINSDSLDFAQVSDVLISKNFLHDFYPTNGAHPDAIQFMTAGTKLASHDVTINDNLIYRGAGQNSQGIFLGDEIGTLPFQNFTISNNTIVGTGFSAIRPTHNTGLKISGNNLVTFAGGDPTNMLVQFSDHVTSANNRSSSIGFSTTTSLSQSGDVSHAPVTKDRGAAVVKDWLATHR